MPIEITMPRLSDTMEEGTLVKWRVGVGDAVASGDHLADVETDKATMELQAFDDGTVAKIAIGEGQTVPVGETILILAEEGESMEDAAGAASAPASAAKASAAPGGDAATVSSSATATAAPPPPATGGNKARISPLARKLAEQRGLDPATISGSGPGGRIIKRDVLTAPGDGSAAKPTHAPAKPQAAPRATPSPDLGAVAATLEAEEIALTSMRKTIAKRLVESKTTIPHFQVTLAINMDPLLDLRKMLNSQLESQGVKLSVNDFITLAAALACVQHPTANASWAEDRIIQHGTVNVGIAVALPAEKGGGLVVPVIRDVQRKGLRQISAETQTLAAKARDTGLSPEEMSDGTITISNLGMYGVDSFNAIINPPQAAILAVGGAIEKPVVRDGQIVIGREMSATLSADHRVLDGVGAAEFLQTLKHLLENPAALLV